MVQCHYFGEEYHGIIVFLSPAPPASIPPPSGGHHFCSDCIHEIVGSGSAPCPICRTHLTCKDLFDTLTAEEEEVHRYGPVQGPGRSSAGGRSGLDHVWGPTGHGLSCTVLRATG